MISSRLYVDSSGRVITPVLEVSWLLCCTRGGMSQVRFSPPLQRGRTELRADAALATKWGLESNTSNNYLFFNNTSIASFAECKHRHSGVGTKINAAEFKQ
jgi:hypothetical protein